MRDSNIGLRARMKWNYGNKYLGDCENGSHVKTAEFGQLYHTSTHPVNYMLDLSINMTYPE
jgi:hypothetical protein